MLGKRIIDVKRCMQLMLSTDAFDAWELSDAKIIHHVSYVIDGHLEEGGCVPYAQVRPICFDMIKGKVTPKQFRFTFLLPKEKYADFLGQAGLIENVESIASLSMNFVYAEDELLLTTGVARTTFSLDKSIEMAWDAYVLFVFRRLEIAMEDRI